jgi:hypothetical protein
MSKTKKVTLEEIGTNWVVRCGTRHLQTQSKAVIGRKKYIKLLKKDFPQWIITNEFPPVEQSTLTTTELIDGEPFVAIVPEQGEGLLNPPRFSETKVVDASIFGEVTEEDKQNYVKLIDGKFNEAIKTLDSKLDRPVDEETGVIENLGQELDQQVKEFIIEEPTINDIDLAYDKAVIMNDKLNRVLDAEKRAIIQRDIERNKVAEATVIEDSPQQSSSNPLKQKEMETKTSNEQQAPNQSTEQALPKQPHFLVKVGKLGLGFMVTSITGPGHFVFETIGDLSHFIAKGFAEGEVSAIGALGILPEIIKLKDGTILTLDKTVHRALIAQRTARYQGYATVPFSWTKSVLSGKSAIPEPTVRPNMQTATA